MVGSHGSTPQSAGATLLLHEDMSTEGTLGGGCVEAEVRKQAFALLERNESDVLKFQLDHDYGWDDGLICGGTMRVAVMPVGEAADVAAFLGAAESLEGRRPARVPLRVRLDGKPVEYRLHIEAPSRLVIAGAGHVGATLAKMAVDLDFEVTVIDDRGEFANESRLPPPIVPIVGDIERTMRAEPMDDGTFVVIVTRGHNRDEQALHAVIERDARYVGMIGSRRKVKLIVDDLAAVGVDRARLELLHAPIGLDIGAVTVPEIAVSILGELIRVRRRDRPATVEGPFELREGPAA